MLKPTVIAAAAIALCLGLGACGGGSSTVVKETETQGKQLMDLKEAYDRGVITEKEYEKTRKQILKGD